MVKLSSIENVQYHEHNKLGNIIFLRIHMLEDYV